MIFIYIDKLFLIGSCSTVKRKWQCPVCNLHLPIESIFVDEYFEDILRNMADSVSDVEISPDASYFPKKSEAVSGKFQVVDLTDDSPPMSPVFSTSSKFDTNFLASSEDSNMIIPGDFDDESELRSATVGASPKFPQSLRLDYDGLSSTHSSPIASLPSSQSPLISRTLISSPHSSSLNQSLFFSSVKECPSSPSHNETLSSLDLLHSSSSLSSSLASSLISSNEENCHLGALQSSSPAKRTLLCLDLNADSEDESEEVEDINIDRGCSNRIGMGAKRARLFNEKGSCV